MRLSGIFIAFCMAVIAVSLGATAHLMLGLSIAEAVTASLAGAAILIAIQAFAAQRQARAAAERQVAELSRGTADLARQVGELGRRVVAAETVIGRNREEARAATAPFGREIELLGGLVQQLAEALAAHDKTLTDLTAARAAEARVSGSRAAQARATDSAAIELQGTALREADAYVPEISAAASPQQDTRPPSPVTDVPTALTRAEPPAAALSPAPRPAPIEPPVALAAEPDPEVSAAIRQGRVELFLQPIVTLPQRKVRHYEATVRLRLADGALLAPPDYEAAAEVAGLMPALDDLLLLRTAQIARRLSGRSRDAALFCSIAAPTVAEGGFFTQIADFLAVNPALAPSLVLGVPQSAVTTMGPIEQEGMAQLSRLGVRFCLDRVTDVEIEPRELGGLGIRFVKARAGVLLDAEASATAAIHTSDLSNLLARFGLDLIVEGIENEGAVLDLLDYDVRFGQGSLFGSPRAVRTETAERVAAPSADVASAPQTAPAAAPPAARDPLPPGPRRRESDQASQRPGAERTQQALAQLARNLMRRA